MARTPKRALVHAAVSLVEADQPIFGEKLEDVLGALWRQLKDSPETRRSYEGAWRRWGEWLQERGVPLLEARTVHVNAYLTFLRDHGRKRTTASHALSVLREIYRVLVVGELLEINPAREVKTYKISSEPRTPWLTEDEIRQLLARLPTWATAQQHRDWLVVATIVGTGLRRAEVAGLLCENLFDSSATQLAARVITKGSKEGTVFFPAWLSSELRSWCEGREGRLFGLTDPAGVGLAVKRVARRTGVNLKRATPHALRRSFATITGQRGVSIEDRQRAMFHENKATTERYDKAVRMMQQVPGDVLADLVTPK